MEYWMLRQYFMADTVTGPSWWKPPKVQGGNDTGTTKWKSVVLNRLAFPTALSKLSSNNFWQDSIGPGIPWCAWECPGVFDCQTPWDTWTKKHVHKQHHLIHVLPTLSIRTPQNWLFWGPYPCYTGSNPSIGGSKKNLRVKKDLMFKSSHQNIPSTTTANGLVPFGVFPPWLRQLRPSSFSSRRNHCHLPWSWHPRCPLGDPFFNTSQPWGCENLYMYLELWLIEHINMQYMCKILNLTYDLIFDMQYWYTSFHILYSILYQNLEHAITYTNGVALTHAMGTKVTPLLWARKSKQTSHHCQITHHKLQNTQGTAHSDSLSISTDITYWFQPSKTAKANAFWVFWLYICELDMDYHGNVPYFAFAYFYKKNI